MKRDLALFRAILLEIENLSVGQSLDGDLYDVPPKLKKFPAAVICEHVRLLKEADLIDAKLIIVPNNFGERQVGALVS